MQLIGPGLILKTSFSTQILNIDKRESTSMPNNAQLKRPVAVTVLPFTVGTVYINCPFWMFSFGCLD